MPRWQKWSNDHSYLHHDTSDLHIAASGDLYDCDLSNGTSNVVDKTKIKKLSYFVRESVYEPFLSQYTLPLMKPSTL